MLRPVVEALEQPLMKELDDEVKYCQTRIMYRARTQNNIPRCISVHRTISLNEKLASPNTKICFCQCYTHTEPRFFSTCFYQNLCFPLFRRCVTHALDADRHASELSTPLMPWPRSTISLWKRRSSSARISQHHSCCASTSACMSRSQNT